MGFSAEIRAEIFVRCARHCCVCHKPKGLNIEIHHIKPRHQGGTDTLENAIALCFDCHADAGHYFANHPKGSKLSPDELLKHKVEWFKIVSENKILEPKNTFVELTVANRNFSGIFRPTFIKEITRYSDRNMYKRIYELLGKDLMEFVNELKESNKKRGGFIDPYLSKVSSYDEVIDYLNGNHIKKDFAKSDNNCQPIIHQFGPFRQYKMIYKSNCVLDLKFTNYGPEVLEDYKLYLTFDNVIEADHVSKRVDVFDMRNYNYNVRFFESNKGEFIPERNVLVQNDSVSIDSICFRPSHKAKLINLNWELFARNIRAEGNLQLDVRPKFEKRSNEQFVESSDKMKNVVKILPKIEFD